MGHGVSINPIAFLVITKDNVRLIPITHSSAIDRILDYMPDLMEKTNNMMNKCIQNKKEETEKIIKKMNSRNNNKNTEKIDKKAKKETKQPEEIVEEFEFDETTDEDDEI